MYSNIGNLTIAKDQYQSQKGNIAFVGADLSRPFAPYTYIMRISSF